MGSRPGSDDRDRQGRPMRGLDLRQIKDWIDRE